MYKIVYTKTAVKDIPNLKSAHLDRKAKALVELVRKNPYQTPLKLSVCGLIMSGEM